jgi:hypothetical protein
MNEDNRKCAHEPCTCKVSPEQKFCSTSCEQSAAASQTHAQTCSCHHDACQGRSESSR